MSKTQASALTRHSPAPIVGCRVNGPGMARRAEFGSAASRGVGVVFARGEMLATLPEGLLSTDSFQTDGSVAVDVRERE